MQIILRIYKPNFIIVFDPLFGMIGFIIFSEYWADGNDVVKVFVIFFFNQLWNKVSLSTACLANEYACMGFFDVLCLFLFDAGFVHR